MWSKNTSFLLKVGKEFEETTPSSGKVQNLIKPQKVSTQQAEATDLKAHSRYAYCCSKCKVSSIWSRFLWLAQVTLQNVDIIKSFSF